MSERFNEREKDRSQEYLAISLRMRAQGYVRPIRYSVVHTEGCGEQSSLSTPDAERMARVPEFLAGVTCKNCGPRPVEEFTWLQGGATVGT